MRIRQRTSYILGGTKDFKVFPMPSVLFVCTANRFRSPLASALFRKTADESGSADLWTVDSAGTWASSGLPVLPAASRIARDYRLDLAGHLSKPVTRSLLASHDLILVMERGHKEALQIEFPESGDRVHLLSQAVEGREYDIPDLIASLESMMEVAEILSSLVRTGFGNICDLAIRLQANRR
jgi:protein-tyrosine-phosphatase